MAVAAGYAVRAFNLTHERVRQTEDVRRQLARLLSLVQDVETGARGYILTGQGSFLAPHAAALESLRTAVPALRRLTSDNTAQQARLDRLEPLIGQRIANAARGIELRRLGDMDAAIAFVASNQGKEIMDAIRAVLGEMQIHEDQLLDRRLAAARRTARWTTSALAAGLAADFVLLALVFAVARHGLRARARAMQELDEARRYSDIIVETVREPLLILTEDLRVARANRSYYLRFKTTPAETERRPLQELAGGRWNVPALFEKLPAVAREHEEFDDLEVVQEFPGLGRKVLLLNARKLYQPGNNTRRLMLAIEDVTERRAAEEERDRFFNVSLDMLCIASAEDGRFRQVSPTVQDVLGLTPEEFLARPYMEQVHPDDREATQRAIELQMVRGEKLMHFENRFRHKDGSWRVLSWRSVPQPDGLMYGVARDVTEQRQAENEIRRLNTDLRRHAAQLEAANRELEAFSYSVSHDLRAPLRHIEGFSQLLSRQQSERLDDAGRHYLEVISGSARKLGVLIDELLNFSRMGRSELRHGLTDMAGLVAEVAREHGAAATERSIEWKIGPLTSVSADAAMIRQVWHNLLGNAVKYTRGRNPAVIEVSHRVDPSVGHVFSVRDNSAGFDMQYAEKLFGVFQRLHSEAEFEGTGVGLANVRRIVERHGGRTWGEGRAGEGATFHFSLPLAPPTGAPSPATSLNL